MPDILTSEICLVADIGATNARFAILDRHNELNHVSVVKCDDFADIFKAIEFYLNQQRLFNPAHVAIAVATPVNADQIKLTNHHWSFSITELKQRLKLKSLQVINDFTAQALGIALLKPDQFIKTGGGNGIEKSNIAVIGPGTGLGVSGLVFSENQWHPVTGEGGHVSVCPSSRKSRQVIELLGKKYQHVSAERVLSGQGILNVYTALCSLKNKTADSDLTPAYIAGNAVNAKCSICGETMALFFEILGTVAADLVLTLGAQKGVYIAGGIIPKNTDLFLNSKFRESFEAHGRFTGYLEKTPSFLITHPYHALTGLSSLVKNNQLNL